MIQVSYWIELAFTVLPELGWAHIQFSLCTASQSGLMPRGLEPETCQVNPVRSWQRKKKYI